MKRILSILALFFTVACWAQQNGPSLFHIQRATLFEMLPVDSTSIVFLGNSITNGGEWHELTGLPNALNRGISGDIVEGVENRLAPIVNGHPAKIFLLIGINDVSHHLSADSIATATINLAKHIRQASPRTELYVQSILPVNPSFGRFKSIEGKDEIIREINSAVAPAVEAMGATWVNLYPAFADEEGHLRTDLTNDGLHLLGPGYVLWASLLAPYLQ